MLEIELRIDIAIATAPFNVISIEVDVDEPMAQFAILALPVCGLIRADNAQLVTMGDLATKTNVDSIWGSGLPVEAVAIAAELKKGRSRTRAFPNPPSKPLHKSLHNGYHHHFQFGPHQPVTPLLWTLRL
ncbi:hypothetical protein ST47_g3495 [Ascochyta rabiei]|uniref:Uncharacterized protein n=1 Tax=Didymella rabiei TaxID=5454 RepID=A0A163HIS1_DIDRA|nr:hypothetical protein ST47_g3495 [Ascochyta rabiei]